MRLLTLPPTLARSIGTSVAIVICIASERVDGIDLAANYAAFLRTRNSVLVAAKRCADFNAGFQQIASMESNTEEFQEPRATVDVR